MPNHLHRMSPDRCACVPLGADRDTRGDGRIGSAFRHAPVAQGIERWVADPKAVGSNPTRRTTSCSSTSAPRRAASGPAPTDALWRPPIPVCYTPEWRGVRVVEGAALEKRCSDELPWVRIPPSPPAVWDLPGRPLPWKGRIAWPSARDWKSRRRLHRLEGSNPSPSATKRDSKVGAGDRVVDLRRARH